MCRRHLGIEATGAEAISKLISHQLSCTAYQESLRIEQLESAAIQAALSNPPLNKELRLRTLKADPFISKIKPLRVLCVACNGWKNLGGEYALYGWHKHKRIIHGYKNHSSLDGNQERMRLLMEDQLVGEVQAFHVFCKSCGIWLRSRDPHKRYSLEDWREHKAEKHAGRSNRANVKRQKSYSSDEDILSSDETDSELENSVLDIDNLVDFKHNSGPELNRSSTLVDVDREQAMTQTSGGKRIDENGRPSTIVIENSYTKEVTKLLGNVLDGHTIPQDVSKITIMFN